MASLRMALLSAVGTEDELEDSYLTEEDKEYIFSPSYGSTDQEENEDEEEEEEEKEEGYFFHYRHDSTEHPDEEEELDEEQQILCEGS